MGWASARVRAAISLRPSPRPAPHQPHSPPPPLFFSLSFTRTCDHLVQRLRPVHQGHAPPRRLQHDAQLLALVRRLRPVRRAVPELELGQGQRDARVLDAVVLAALDGFFQKGRGQAAQGRPGRQAPRVREQDGRVNHRRVDDAQRPQVVLQAVADQQRVGRQVGQQAGLDVAQAGGHALQHGRRDAGIPGVVLDDGGVGQDELVQEDVPSPVHQADPGDLKPRRRLAHLAVQGNQGLGAGRAGAGGDVARGWLPGLTQRRKLADLQLLRRQAVEGGRVRWGRRRRCPGRRRARGLGFPGLRHAEQGPHRLGLPHVCPLGQQGDRLAQAAAQHWQPRPMRPPRLRVQAGHRDQQHALHQGLVPHKRPLGRVGALAQHPQHQVLDVVQADEADGAQHDGGAGLKK